MHTQPHNFDPFDELQESGDRSQGVLGALIVAMVFCLGLVLL